MSEAMWHIECECGEKREIYSIEQAWDMYDAGDLICVNCKRVLTKKLENFILPF